MPRVLFALASLGVAFGFVACQHRPADPPRPTAPAASASDASDAGPRAREWARARPRSIEEVVSAKEPFKVFVLGKEILAARREGDRFRLARVERGKLVDEDAWSRGLPAIRRSSGEPAFPCNDVGAIFGRFPDRLWLIESSGGSMQCSSTFGEYRVWRRTNGTWSKDAAHSPPPSKPPEGVFATWPLGPAVLGVGVSNLVGDTLTAPVDAMFPLDPDPWATRVHLAREGWSILAVCASASGIVATLSANAGHIALETIERNGARSSVDVPPAHAPEGPCAASTNAVLLVQPPARPGQHETWVAFDRTARAWTPIEAPWPYRTSRLDFVGARIVARTADADGHPHLFVGTHESRWIEIEGVPGSQLEVVSTTADDEVLVFVDETRLVRIGLPRP